MPTNFLLARNIIKFVAFCKFSARQHIWTGQYFFWNVLVSGWLARRWKCTHHDKSETCARADMSVKTCRNLSDAYCLRNAISSTGRLDPPVLMVSILIDPASSKPFLPERYVIGCFLPECREFSFEKSFLCENKEWAVWMFNGSFFRLPVYQSNCRFIFSMKPRDFSLPDFWQAASKPIPRRSF